MRKIKGANIVMRAVTDESKEKRVSSDVGNKKVKKKSANRIQPLEHQTTAIHAAPTKRESKNYIYKLYCRKTQQKNRPN